MRRSDEDQHADERVDDATEPATEPLKVTFGTAVGAAMLGLEQALRNEPPPEVMAAEHLPERGRSGDAGADEADGGLVIEFPEDLESR
jgi:hypothetical protein